MREVEATGKNIEQAVENALLELKAAREDVDIKILSEGGFLKKAKVLVSISADALEKYEKKESLKKSLAEEENDEDFAENFMKKSAEAKPVEPKQEAKKAEAPKPEAKTEKPAPKAAEKKTAPKAEKAAKADENTDEPKVVENAGGERALISCEEFLQGVLNSLGLDGQIERTEDEKFVRMSVVGENLTDIIGHHGECMLALSHLMNLTCESNHKKIILDVGGYRAKREESLTILAKRTADKVAKSGRYIKFEPMDASERKIIHSALQNDDRVTTLSKGEEPYRYLIVFPKEYKD